MLNVITGFESNLLKIKAGELPEAVLKEGGKKKTQTTTTTKKPTMKTHQQPRTAYFIFTSPHSCQVNSISLCFMKNSISGPKAILYSQKVLNKYTFTITHNYFFGPIKAAQLFWFGGCVLTCNTSLNWKGSHKITKSFLISKTFPSCPSVTRICATTSSLRPVLTSLQL